MLRLLFKPKQLGKDQEIEKIKIIVPINFYPTRNRKIQKSSKKIIKQPLGFSSSRVRKGREREKVKIIVPINFYPTHNRKFQRNSKAILKIKNTMKASFKAKTGR